MLCNRNAGGGWGWSSYSRLSSDEAEREESQANWGQWRHHRVSLPRTFCNGCTYVLENLFWRRFAGATADALTLMTRLETKIEAYPCTLPICPGHWCVSAQIHSVECIFLTSWVSHGLCLLPAVPSIVLVLVLLAFAAQLQRACVELAKEWRTEKYLRQLEVLPFAAAAVYVLTVSGLWLLCLARAVLFCSCVAACYVPRQ